LVGQLRFVSTPSTVVIAPSPLLSRSDLRHRLGAARSVNRRMQQRRVVVQTWFNLEQIRADLSEPEPL
jgi:hypothetical protein